MLLLWFCCWAATLFFTMVFILKPKELNYVEDRDETKDKNYSYIWNMIFLVCPKSRIFWIFKRHWMIFVMQFKNKVLKPLRTLRNLLKISFQFRILNIISIKFRDSSVCSRCVCTNRAPFYNNQKINGIVRFTDHFKAIQTIQIWFCSTKIASPLIWILTVLGIEPSNYWNDFRL